MARALLICHRNHQQAQHTLDSIALLNERLTPDNLVPERPRTACRDGIVSAVLAPCASTEMHDVSIRLGAVADGAGHWWKPEEAVPDGSFALLRADSDHAEIVMDGAASRTIWYVLTDDLFVASSSQRAIVSLLASFEPNAEAAAWMMSSSTLGPGHAWDRRLAWVPPGGRVLLDRHGWRLRVAGGPGAPFAAELRSQAEHRQRLERAVETAVARLQHDPAAWLLPLSGGVDSRGLLLAYLRAGVPPGRLTCVTWGRRAALDEPSSDAWVARQLARRFGVQHNYFETDVSNEDRDALITRFLVAGEGRIGHISGYLDGFELWKNIRAAGVDGVIRGDQTFGAHAVETPLEARRSVGLLSLEDHFSTDLLKRLDAPPQTFPAEFGQRPDEPLIDWRDRLRQDFRLPAVLAALTDLKSAYVEVLNPLLCESVLATNRSLPPHLRADKRLWREVVESWGPKIPLARSSATVSLTSFLDDHAMLERMHDELGSSRAAGTLGSGTSSVLRGYVEDAIAARRSRDSAAGRAIAVARRKARSAVRKLRGRPESLEPIVFAFRGYLASRMHGLLAADSVALAPGGARRTSSDREACSPATGTAGTQEGLRQIG